MIVAIVPAAGKSERMGRPKLLLPLGNRLVIEHVLDSITQSSLPRCFVVLPPRSHSLAEIVRQYSKAEAVVLEQPTDDMLASIRSGLAYVETELTPDAFVVALGDQPTISPAVIHQLVEAFRSDPAAVVIPTHQGKNGHPILLAWDMVETVRAIPPGQGLNSVIDLPGRRTVRVPVGPGDLPHDMDTPADYDQLRRQFPPG